MTLSSLIAASLIARRCTLVVAAAATAIALVAAPNLATATPVAGVDYEEVNFHFDSVVAGNCTGEFGVPGSNGHCDGVFTDGHVAPLTNRAPGTVTWTSIDTLSFRISHTGALLTGTVPSRGSDRYSPNVFTYPGARIAPLASVDPALAAGTKGGPLHLNVVASGTSVFGFSTYHIYVHGWAPRLATATAPPTALPLFGSS